MSVSWIVDMVPSNWFTENTLQPCPLKFGSEQIATLSVEFVQQYIDHLLPPFALHLPGVDWRAD